MFLLARGIRSYHRPTRIEDALSLAGDGAAPLAGGSRLLARDGELPNVLDLLGLGIAGTGMRDEDLEIGAMTTVEDLVRSPEVHAATASLLPAACRASLPSRVLRGMATIGGEAVTADRDSELVAALLALNAVFIVATKDGLVESPALRFLRDPSLDLAGGGLLLHVVVPGAPDGAALERVAALPSLPPLVSVAVGTTFSAQRLARVRIAVTGLAGPPARITEAEALIERTSGEDSVLVEAAEAVAKLALFRDDVRASADHRRRMARPLALRAIRSAVELGRRRARAAAVPLPALPAPRVPPPMPYFTSGRLELTVNGRRLRAEAEARTTLASLLRDAGLFGVKAGCGSGRCGACTVLLDGRPVASCLTLAAQVHGRAVATAEGLGSFARPHPLQAAFARSGAAQCGFCTPAQVISSRALLDLAPKPSDAEVRWEMGGLCRCTGYGAQVAAVLASSERGDS